MMLFVNDPKTGCQLIWVTNELQAEKEAFEFSRVQGSFNQASREKNYKYTYLHTYKVMG